MRNGRMKAVVDSKEFAEFKRWKETERVPVRTPEDDDLIVRRVVKEVESLLAAHGVVCEAQVIIQGATVRTNVVFRKNVPADIPR